MLRCGPFRVFLDLVDDGDQSHLLPGIEHAHERARPVEGWLRQRLGLHVPVLNDVVHDLVDERDLLLVQIARVYEARERLHGGIVPGFRDARRGP